MTTELIFDQYSLFVNAFWDSIERLCEVVGMRPIMMMFAIGLMLVGLLIFFYGTSIANDVLNSKDLLSGTYIAVVGCFLAIAGFLVMVSQVFRGHSVIY
ncbi:MAG: hypothetical protein PVH73_08825 [Candidatus Bathyarchaeota archaeon]